MQFPKAEGGFLAPPMENMLYLCKEDETYLDYKVTLEKQFAIFIFPMTSLFWLTSALLYDDVIINVKNQKWP